MNDIAPQQGKEVSSLLIAPLLEALQARLSHEEIAQLSPEAAACVQRPLEEVGSVSFDCFAKLLEALVEITASPESVFCAARIPIRERRFSRSIFWLRHFASPQAFYNWFIRRMNDWYKITELQLMAAGRNSCMIAETIRDERTNPDSELFVHGLLSTIPHYFGLPFAAVSKFDSAPREPGDYIYELTWVARPGRWWSATGMAIGLLVAIGTAFLLGWETLTFYQTAIFMLIGYSAGREVDLLFGTREIYRLCNEQADSLATTTRMLERVNRELAEAEETIADEKRAAETSAGTEEDQESDD